MQTDLQNTSTQLSTPLPKHTVCTRRVTPCAQGRPHCAMAACSASVKRRTAVHEVCLSVPHPQHNASCSSDTLQKQLPELMADKRETCRWGSGKGLGQVPREVEPIGVMSTGGGEAHYVTVWGLGSTWMAIARGTHRSWMC